MMASRVRLKPDGLTGPAKAGHYVCPPRKTLVVSGFSRTYRVMCRLSV